MSIDPGRPAIKFCGLTRPEDARFAVSLGASYVGVIFASGPRLITEERAAEVFAGVPDSVGRVGVFADQRADEIARMARALRLRAVQLNGHVDAKRVVEIRRISPVEVWPAIRIAGAELPEGAAEVAASSDVLVLDSFVRGMQGGSGVAFDWGTLAGRIDSIRTGKRVVLAGGLRASNVAQAIAAVGPDVVDVSSGVESAPGIKDHTQMRLFRDAALMASMSA